MGAVEMAMSYPRQDLQQWLNQYGHSLEQLGETGWALLSFVQFLECRQSLASVWIEAQRIDIENLQDDTFRHKTKVHDWRNHVPEEIEENWKMFDYRDRKLIAFITQSFADKEEWD